MREHKGQFLCPMHGTPLSAYKERGFGAKDFTCSKCGDTHSISAGVLPICPRCFSNLIILSRPPDEILICSNPKCSSHYFEDRMCISNENIITMYRLFSGINITTLLFSLEIIEVDIIQDFWQYKGKFITELIVNIVRDYFTKTPSAELNIAMKKHPFPLLNGIYKP